jgi:hypothetical protein
VLVHGDGPCRERGAGQPEFLVGEALQPLVLVDLPPDGVESARGAGVPRDGCPDPGVEPGDLGGDGARLGPVLLERSGTRARRRGGEDACRPKRAQRREGDERQSTYRVAAFQSASSRGRRLAPPRVSRASGSGRQRGQGRNLALAGPRLKRRNSFAAVDASLSDALSAYF